LLIAAAGLLPALAQNSKPFVGRWDMTVTIGTGQFPSWLEVTDKGGTLEARVCSNPRATWLRFPARESKAIA
jgi:hypothetical protein